ncbi:hypothetical protein QAD02_002353 [Eretmocerus hayati]|uniref:Uncharacterized protein n=1 Tax=Eretmocerus hayati TaxID=131215 RepID=A0ACC2NIM1_9HYME|nr:hypothetical protein QAD02_002353 [Eretmocerus hayati]
MKGGEMLMLLQEGETWSKLCDFQEFLTISTPLLSTSTSSDILLGEQGEPSTQLDQETPSNAENAQNPLINQEANPQDQENINFSNFVIPWHKLDRKTFSALSRGVRDDEIRKTTVRLVIAELRFINCHILSGVLKIVAQQMVDEYPASFEDRLSDGKTRAGDGTATILTRLIYHNNEENRKHNKRKSLEDVLPAYKNHCLDSTQAGCTNWGPEPPPDVTEEEMENQRVKLLHSTTETNLEEHKEAMQDTFLRQRKFINAKDFPSVEKIEQVWPCLFRKELMPEHFHLLTGKDINLLSDKLSP